MFFDIPEISWLHKTKIRYLLIDNEKKSGWEQITEHAKTKPLNKFLKIFPALFETKVYNEEVCGMRFQREASIWYIRVEVLSARLILPIGANDSMKFGLEHKRLNFKSL